MKSKLKAIILITTVAILLLGGTWFILQNRAKAKEEPKTLSADEIVAAMVETESMTTNLKTGGFIQLQFKIQTSSKEAKEELENRLFLVNNIAIRLMSAMNEKQVKSPDGMAAFEGEMKKELNKEMQEGQIVQVYTTNKMIQ